MVKRALSNSMSSEIVFYFYTPCQINKIVQKKKKKKENKM